MIKKKSSIRLLIIALVCVMMVLAAVQFKSFATTGKATVDILRIREKPSTEAEVINVLDVNDAFEIIGEEGDWYKISFKGETGYVSKTYVTANGNVENTNTQPETKPEENNTQNNENTETQNPETPVNNNENTNNAENNTNTSKATITKKLHKISDNSNVNIIPVITSEVIGEVKKDEQVQLLGSAGLWAYINSSSVSGWIRIDKLSDEVIEVTEEITIEENNNDENNATDNTQNENKDDNNSTENQKTDENTVENKEEQNNQENKEDNNQNNNQTQTINYDEAKTLYVKVEAVNIRTESNTNSDIVNGLEQNASVKVIGEENDWYKVEVNGDKGFIRKDLLSTEKVEVTSRSNDFDRTAQTTTNNTNTVQNNQKQTQSNTQQAPAQTQAPAQQTTTSSSGVTGADVAAYAQQFVGCKYVYAAAGPNAFDCSGLTMYVYNHFGYSLSHSSRVQATQGKAVTGDLQPGDILVFSNDGKNVGHVGIYIGNDKFVHASDSTTGVIISNLHDSWNIKKYWGARRIL